jgi:guanylate kinase
VSHTTRKPREGEVNGVHYHFVTKEQIEEDIAKGLFVEHACVHGNYYGTSLAAVQSVAKSGKVR